MTTGNGPRAKDGLFLLAEIILQAEQAVRNTTAPTAKASLKELQTILTEALFKESKKRKRDPFEVLKTASRVAKNTARVVDRPETIIGGPPPEKLSEDLGSGLDPIPQPTLPQTEPPEETDSETPPLE